MEREFFVTVLQLHQGTSVLEQKGFLIYVPQDFPLPSEQAILATRKREYPSEKHGHKERIKVSEAVYQYYRRRPVFTEVRPTFRSVTTD